MGFFDNAQLKSAPVTSGLSKCGACGLNRECVSPRMEPTGTGKHRILFVGEAPSAEEDRLGTHFVSDPGKYLRGLLKPTGINMDDCHKTNAIICHPPRTEVQDIHVEACRPNLLRTIAQLKPTVIVLLGTFAVRSIIGPEWHGDVGPLGRWVGWTIPSAKFNAWLCPTYHPSHILKEKEDPPLVRMAQWHLASAMELEHKAPDYLVQKDLEKSVEIITSPRLYRLRLRELAKKSGRLAWDYEATGLKPERPEQEIVSASFCLNGVDTFAGPVDPRCYDDLSAVLKNPQLRKVASNMKFEERWTICKLGHPVAGWEWDTMLAAHVIDNRRQITSVKFQTFVYFGIGDYSSHVEHLLKADPADGANGLNRIREIPITDLLLYNGMDSLVEYKVAERQMGLIGRSL